MVKWEENLFACCDSKAYSCLVVLFPFCYPIFQGCTVHNATGEPWSKACFCPLLLCCIGAAINRGKIRDRYLINGSFCEDCLTHCLCSCCALCQEYSEVKRRETM